MGPRQPGKWRRYPDRGFGKGWAAVDEAPLHNRAPSPLSGN